MLKTIRGVYVPLLGILVFLLIWIPVAVTAECFLWLGKLITRAANSIEELADRMMTL